MATASTYFDLITKFHHILLNVDHLQVSILKIEIKGFMDSVFMNKGIQASSSVLGIFPAGPCGRLKTTE